MAEGHLHVQIDAAVAASLAHAPCVLLALTCPAANVHSAWRMVHAACYHSYLNLSPGEGPSLGLGLGLGLGLY